MKMINEMAFKGNSITIFDLDDTLIVTSARIAVKDSRTGQVFHLTPQEFNEYEAQPHHEVDFSQFEDPEILKAGKLVDRILSILKNTYENETPVGIITARNRGNMIRDFFLEHNIDIHPKFVIAVNDPAEGFHGSVAQKKQQAFRRLHEMGYTNFIFFDDDLANLELAKDLENELGISVTTHRVTAEDLPQLEAKQIGIFTGKFKPPHLGHYEMIKRFAEDNDEFHVFVSPIPAVDKKGNPQPGSIDGVAAVEILKIYFSNNPKIHIHLAQKSPVTAAYEFVEALGKEPSAANYTINLYALPKDMVRFAAMEKWLGGIKRVNRIETERPEFTDDASAGKGGDDDGVSGELMRSFVASGDKDSFFKGLPHGVDKERIWNIVSSGSTSENATWAVPADSFNQQIDPNVMPTDVNVPVGGLPAHWTTTQPYSRFDLKTNPLGDRYGLNPKAKRAIVDFEEFCQNHDSEMTSDEPGDSNTQLYSEHNK